MPTDSELRVAQAQLVGWLEGLFHGIQTTLFAQQMAARAQLEQMRRALPPGVQPGQLVLGTPRGDDTQGQTSGGMYSVAAALSSVVQAPALSREQRFDHLRDAVLVVRRRNVVGADPVVSRPYGPASPPS